MVVHESAQKGFSGDVAVYERGRPSYPEEAVAYCVRELGLRKGRSVLDVGAGSGKFTSFLMSSGADVAALEPVPEMRNALQRRFPSVRLIDGTAESIGLGDGTLDAVVVAQAFHWFDPTRAMHEFFRVLRSGERVALVWNVRDPRCEWVREIWKTVESYAGTTPRHHTGAWRVCLTPGVARIVEERQFSWLWPSSHDMIVDRVLSISFIAALDPRERLRVEQEVRRVLVSHGETHHCEIAAFPYETHVHIVDRG